MGESGALGTVRGAGEGAFASFVDAGAVNGGDLPEEDLCVDFFAIILFRPHGGQRMDMLLRRV